MTVGREAQQGVQNLRCRLAQEKTRKRVLPGLVVGFSCFAVLWAGLAEDIKELEDIKEIEAAVIVQVSKRAA